MLGRGSRDKSKEPDVSGDADSSLSPSRSSVAVADREFVPSAENGGDSSRPRLGELLVSRGVATPEQIEEALSQQESGALFGQLLVDMGTISQSELLDTLAAQFGVQSIDLNIEALDPEAAVFVPEDFARAHLVVAVSCVDKHLRVAVADPSQELRRNLEKLSGCSVEMFLAPVNVLRSAIETQYRALGGVRDLIRAFEAVEGSRRQTTGNDQQESPGDDAPIVQVVNRILTQALRDRASDVHIEPQTEVVRVRFRIDGTLKEVLELPGAMGLGLISRIKIMAGMNIVERRRPQDGQLTLEVDGKSVDVRVATVATISGEKCVMRVLDKTRSVMRLNDLGMPEDTHRQFSELVRAPF